MPNTKQYVVKADYNLSKQLIQNTYSPILSWSFPSQFDDILLELSGTCFCPAYGEITPSLFYAKIMPK